MAKCLFEAGSAYQCRQDTHLIDYKLIKKRAGYRISQRAIRINKGEIILCLDSSELDGEVAAVFLVREEIVHIQEHSSTLRALHKSMAKINL